jgi:ketosteroid isomerase-like protein
MIETLERLYAAWNRVDLNGVVALFHPECELRTSGDYPGVESVYRGHVGVRAFWRDSHDPWEALRVEPERYEEAGGRMLVLLRFAGTARDGLAVEREGAHLVRVEDGLIADLQACGSWAKGLANAGLAE